MGDLKSYFTAPQVQFRCSYPTRLTIKKKKRQGMEFKTGKILKRENQRNREVFGHRRPEKVDDDLTLHAKTNCYLSS